MESETWKPAPSVKPEASVESAAFGCRFDFCGKTTFSHCLLLSIRRSSDFPYASALVAFRADGTQTIKYSIYSLNSIDVVCSIDVIKLSHNWDRKRSRLIVDWLLLLLRIIHAPVTGQRQTITYWTIRTLFIARLLRDWRNPHLLRSFR